MSTGLFLEKKDKNMLIVITILIFVLVSDTMINQVSDFLVPQLISNFGVGLFCAFAIIVGISQYFILDYVKRKIDDQYTKSHSTRFLHKLISLIQYFLVAVLVFLVLQILLTASYSSYVIIALSAISYLLSIGLMTYFAKKFLTWYLSNKRSIVVLLYCVSFALVAIASSIAIKTDL
jgi:hypothetical protein